MTANIRRCERGSSSSSSSRAENTRSATCAHMHKVPSHREATTRTNASRVIVSLCTTDRLSVVDDATQYTHRINPAEESVRSLAHLIPIRSHSHRHNRQRRRVAGWGTGGQGLEIRCATGRTEDIIDSPPVNSVRVCGNRRSTEVDYVVSHTHCVDVGRRRRRRSKNSIT